MRNMSLTLSPPQINEQVKMRKDTHGIYTLPEDISSKMIELKSTDLEDAMDRIKLLEEENRNLRKELDNEKAKADQKVKEHGMLQDKVAWLEQQMRGLWRCDDETLVVTEETSVTEETDPLHMITNIPDLTSSGQPFDQDTTNPDDFCNDRWCTMDEIERNDSFYYQRHPPPQCELY